MFGIVFSRRAGLKNKSGFTCVRLESSLGVGKKQCMQQPLEHHGEKGGKNNPKRFEPGEIQPKGTKTRP